MITPSSVNTMMLEYQTYSQRTSRKCLENTINKVYRLYYKICVKSRNNNNLAANCGIYPKIIEKL